MNILFLSHRIPYPPNKGDKIRSFNEIKYLSKNHNIFLCSPIDDKSDEKYIKNLSPFCKEIEAVYFNGKKNLIKNIFSHLPFSVAFFYDESIQRYVDNVLEEKEIDIVICFCSSMAEYIFRNPLFKNNQLKNIKLIMDYVDLDSDKWLQYSRYGKFPLNIIFKIENQRLSKYELKINKAFHRSIFVSEREISVFRKSFSEIQHIAVIPNGVDHEYFSPKKDEPGNDCNPPLLVFTGFMDYFANEDGVKWFCDKIFPIIKKEIPSVQFYIVGNKPSKIVKKLSLIEGVHVTGYVEDIRKYYWMADVCVIPLRIARGQQNKVMEAMATGNAIVATSNAIDGIVSHDNQDLIVANDEQKFANEVILLLKNREKRIKLGANAINNIRSNYSWKNNLALFDKILK